MKVAILWTHLSGYLNACMKELAGREGVELFVCNMASHDEAPFDESQFNWIGNRLVWTTNAEVAPLLDRLEGFKPDVMIMAGWHIGAYRRAARAFAGKTLRIMVMDNPWRGTVKQYLGILISRLYLHPLVDTVWLPGERQAVFAKKLGFREGRILRGSFSCDQKPMAAMHLARLAEGRPVPRKFLFVGRFAPVKAIRTLVEAYRIYRNSEPHPWPLICCGTGPDRRLLENQEGVEIRGFVQPEAMPAQMAEVGCFVLPSTFDPFPLVILEATSAGLVILASENVGSAVHLVQPHFNGFITRNRDAAGLAKMMSRVSRSTDGELDAMSRASFLLSQQFSPTRWANTIIQHYRDSQHEERVRPVALITDDGRSVADGCRSGGHSPDR